MKIALGSVHAPRPSIRRGLAIAADIGYDAIELSPRSDFIPFFTYRAPSAVVSPSSGTAWRDRRGIEISSVLPLYRWSSPDESERLAAVRYWKRAIQLTVDARRDGGLLNSEFNGRPEAARRPARRSSGRSMEELLPIFDREGIQLNLESIAP